MCIARQRRYISPCALRHRSHNAKELLNAPIPSGKVSRLKPSANTKLLQPDSQRICTMKKLNVLLIAIITFSLAFSTSVFADTPKKVQKNTAQHATAQHTTKQNTKTKNNTAKHSITKNKSHTATQHAVNNKQQSKKKSTKSKHANAA